MIRIVVLPENKPYSEGRQAWFTGWVTYKGRIMGMVADDGDGYPYMVSQSLIRFMV